MTYISLEDSQQMMAVAMQAARQAVDVIDTSRHGRHDFVSKQEAAPDPVTADDRAVERRISEVLDSSDHAGIIVGEEFGRRGVGRIEWHVDPIDGTQNYISQIPFYCISIGAVVEKRVVACAIYDPVRQEMFSADLESSYLDGVPLRSVGAATDDDAVLATAYPDRRQGYLDPQGDTWHRWGTVQAQFRSVRRLGSAALELAYVAAGRIDVMHGVCVNSWDLAAGSLLVENAGGSFMRVGADGDDGAAAWSGPECVAACGSYELDQSALSYLWK